MKVKRILSFLLVLIILILSFCIPASAKGTSSTVFYSRSKIILPNFVGPLPDDQKNIVPEFRFNSYSDVRSGSQTHLCSNLITYGCQIQHVFRFDSGTDEFFVEKGDQGFVRITGVVSSLNYMIPGIISKSISPMRYRVRYKYADNTYSDYLQEDFTISWSGNVLSIEFPFSAPKDVLEFEIYIVYGIGSTDIYRYPDSSVTFTSKIGCDSLYIGGKIETGDSGILASIFGFIRNISSKLGTVVNNLFSVVSKLDPLGHILTGVRSIYDFIINLPQLIAEAFSGLFSPDHEALKQDLLGLIDSVNHTFNLAIDSADWLKDSFTEEAIPDVVASIQIPGLVEMDLPFFNTKYLRRGIEFFRPIIRGFIVLLLCFFHYKQLLTFIGQDPGIYASSFNSMKKSD